MLMFTSLLFVCFASIYAGESVYPDCQNPDNNERIPNGSKFKLENSGDCIEFTCKDGGYSASSVECDNNGECVAVGRTVEENCRSKKCVYDKFVGFQVTETKCEDDEGQCHSPGEEFTRTYQGTTYSKTTCTVDGNLVKYSYKN
ncbi:hypothetical protein LOTGIDRAFT_157590 [Lottia gigantea]|uniref:Sushi domain-containing protein n=1 Tax=Lottia gigantea TaxID=225164 RepID=V4ABR1_LOTGI|nr:hypothetical protein LOTGIDRAFT_157590 [Lottia gigantea]ESP01409.1 hypothetical protein LOTGIDRAFT_157590 [Lottia gigantea]